VASFKALNEIDRRQFRHDRAFYESRERLFAVHLHHMFLALA
jgi:hypothetical protein